MPKRANNSYDSITSPFWHGATDSGTGWQFSRSEYNCKELDKSGVMTHVPKVSTGRLRALLAVPPKNGTRTFPALPYRFTDS
jgi:hypothetical protein